MIDVLGSPLSYKPMSQQYNPYVGGGSQNPYSPQGSMSMGGPSVRPTPGLAPFPSGSFGPAPSMSTQPPAGQTVDQGFMKNGGFDLGNGFQNLPGGGLLSLLGVGNRASNYASQSTQPFTDSTPFSTVQNDFTNTMNNLSAYLNSNPQGQVWAGQNNMVNYGNDQYLTIPNSYGGNPMGWLQQQYNNIYGNYAKMGAFGGPSTIPSLGGR